MTSEARRNLCIEIVEVETAESAGQERVRFQLLSGDEDDLPTVPQMINGIAKAFCPHSVRIDGGWFCVCGSRLLIDAGTVKVGDIIDLSKTQK